MFSKYIGIVLLFFIVLLCHVISIHQIVASPDDDEDSSRQREELQDSEDVGRRKFEEAADQAVFANSDANIPLDKDPVDDQTSQNNDDEVKPTEPISDPPNMTDPRTRSIDSPLEEPTVSAPSQNLSSSENISTIAAEPAMPAATTFPPPSEVVSENKEVPVQQQQQQADVVNASINKSSAPEEIAMPVTTPPPHRHSVTSAPNSEEVENLPREADDHPLSYSDDKADPSPPGLMEPVGPHSVVKPTASSDESEQAPPSQNQSSSSTTIAPTDFPQMTSSSATTTPSPIDNNVRHQPVASSAPVEERQEVIPPETTTAATTTTTTTTTTTKPAPVVETTTVQVPVQETTTLTTPSSTEYSPHHHQAPPGQVEETPSQQNVEPVNQTRTDDFVPPRQPAPAPTSGRIIPSKVPRPPMPSDPSKPEGLAHRDGQEPVQPPPVEGQQPPSTTTATTTITTTPQNIVEPPTTPEPVRTEQPIEPVVKPVENVAVPGQNIQQQQQQEQLTPIPPQYVEPERTTTQQPYIEPPRAGVTTPPTRPPVELPNVETTTPSPVPPPVESPNIEEPPAQRRIHPSDWPNKEEPPHLHEHGGNHHHHDEQERPSTEQRTIEPPPVERHLTGQPNFINKMKQKLATQPPPVVSTEIPEVQSVEPVTQSPYIEPERFTTQQPPVESSNVEARPPPSRPSTEWPNRDSHEHGSHRHHHQHDTQERSSQPAEPRGEEIIPTQETSHFDHQPPPVQSVETLHQPIVNDENEVRYRHHSHENRTHYLLDDIIEHYLESLPLSAKTFLLSQPFGLSLSTTLMATLIPIVVFLWSSVSLLMSAFFGHKRVAPTIDLEYVRNLESKHFSLEKEVKELKKVEQELVARGNADRQGEFEALHSESVHMRAEIIRLNGALCDEQMAREEATRALRNIHEEHARLLKNMGLFEDKTNELGAIVSAKDEQIVNLSGQLQQYVANAASTSEQLSELLSQNEALKMQISSRDEEVGQISTQYAQLEAYCADRAREYEALYKSFSEIEMIQRSENCGEDALKQLVDSSKIRADLEAKTFEHARIQDELETVKSTAADLEGKLALLRDENVELKRLEATAQQEKREAETKLSVLSEYFTSRELELQKQIGEESVWRKHGENQSDTLTKQVLSLEAEVKAHKEQVEYLKSELNAVEQSHKAEIAREEKKALESWASARSFERQLKETQSEAEALRQQLTSAVTKGAGGAPPPFFPPPPGLIPPMPAHLLQPPPPPWALRPPSDRSSQGASSPRTTDNSILQSSSEFNTSSASLLNQSANNQQQQQMSPTQRTNPPPMVPPANGSGGVLPTIRLPFVPPQMGRGLTPPVVGPSPHSFLNTPPARPGMPFPPRPGMPVFPVPPRQMAPQQQYSSNESAHEEEESGSETGSSSGSEDEELRTLAAGGGMPPRPPFMPPNFPPGAGPPGQFFPPPPGQMPPFVPGGPPRGFPVPTPPFGYSGASGQSPANFPRAPFPPPPMPPQNTYRPPQINPGLGP